MSDHELKIDLKIERFEEYYGDAVQVKKMINECSYCGGKLIFSHLPDYKHLFVQETSRCPSCGKSHHKKLHVMN